MAHFPLKRLWHKLLDLLYRRTILILSGLFIVAVAIALTSMSHLANMLIESQAFQSAQLSASALNTARDLYSDHVVSTSVNISSQLAIRSLQLIVYGYGGDV